MLSERLDARGSVAVSGSSTKGTCSTKGLRRAVAVSVCFLGTVLFGTRGVDGATVSNWPSYLSGPAHESFAPASTAISTSNASTLVRAWRFVVPAVSGSPGRQLYASPTVFGGYIYIGANNGVFYKLNETTGAIAGQRSLAYNTALTCSAHGFVSTATVAPDPSRANQLTIYVGAADGYLYALKASDLSTVWRTSVYPLSPTVNDYFNWSSPTVINGRVYVGVSSDCDQPLVRGGVKAFSQDNGDLVATYLSVPPGSVGGSVWTSVAADSSSVWATVGNGDPSAGANPGDSFSIVRLEGATLVKEDIWTVPGLAGTDDDFGASPTLFTATLNGLTTPMVGACNKNGIFYAWQAEDLSAGPVWSRRITTANKDIVCLAAAVFDHSKHRLFVAARETDIGGTHYLGSIRRLDPATGSIVWSRGLPAPVLGSPSLDGSGVLAVGMWPGGHLLYLLNARNGHVLKRIDVGAPVFAQPVFADSYLFVATTGGVLYAYGP
jgi:outer membrane protein assembly factor BamB